MITKKHVADILDEGILFYDKNMPIGFLSGKAGVCYYYFEASKEFNNDRYFNFAEKVLLEIIETLSSNEESEDTSFNPYSICDGISGVYFMFNKLMELGIMEYNEILFTKKINTKLLNCMKLQIENKNYDLLHGGLGIYQYFVSSYKCNLIEKEEMKLITELFVNSIKLICCNSEKYGTYIYSEYDRIKYSSSEVVNLGMAHGISSVIQVLCLIIKEFEEEMEIDEIKDLLIKISGFYRNIKNEISENNSYYFPFHFNLINVEKDFYGRLAWCYGDLSISLALINAGIYGDNTEIYDFGMEVFMNCSKILDDQNAGIDDAGFCHGSTGIIAISRLICSKLNNFENELFNEKWIDYSIKQSKFENGISGYKSFIGKENELEKWENNICLIDGTTGIASIYMSILNNRIPRWFESIALF